MLEPAPNPDLCVGTGTDISEYMRFVCKAASVSRAHAHSERCPNV